MVEIAGLKDSRGYGQVADTGLFYGTASAIVVKYTFSGTTYYTVIRSGARGWIQLTTPNTVCETVINASLTALGAGARIVLLSETYVPTAQITFTANGQALEGQGIGRTIVDASAWASADVHVIDMGSFANCSLCNFTVSSRATADMGYTVIVRRGASGFQLNTIKITGYSGCWIGHGEPTGTLGGVIDGDIYNCQFQCLNQGASKSRDIYMECDAPYDYPNFERINIINNKFYVTEAWDARIVMCYDLVNCIIVNNVFQATIGNRNYSVLEIRTNNSWIPGSNIIANNRFANFYVIPAGSDVAAIQNRQEQNIIMGNKISSCHAGIFSFGIHTIINGNSIFNSYYMGITISSYVMVTNNYIDRIITGAPIAPMHAAIYLGGGNSFIAHNTIKDASYAVNNQNCGIYIPEANDNIIVYNYIYDDPGGSNFSAYCIYISNSSLRTVVIGNRMKGAATALLCDLGTNTILATISMPFVAGTDPQDSGFLINAAQEQARTYLFVPPDVQQVVRMNVYGRCAVAETHQMLADFTIYGAKDNEPYDTHDGSVASLKSTTINFANNDIVYWTVTSAGVLALLARDSVEVKIFHRATAGVDIETNAYMRTVSIEYV